MSLHDLSFCEYDSIDFADISQKGEAVTEAWNEARKRTTAAGLGGMVYAKLLRYPLQ
jgi:hypothetical protein